MQKAMRGSGRRRLRCGGAQSPKWSRIRASPNRAKSPICSARVKSSLFEITYLLIFITFEIGDAEIVSCLVDFVIIVWQ
uniref:Uncharacterized protein n=1 Tax=Kalanchoe fedtschenkoi TaxID=63787 RepID=A0A7N0VHL5_KALFE